MQDLTDKTVVITGASRGIGAAIARAFAFEGCKLVLCGRDEAALKTVATELNLPDQDVIGVIADITKAAGMKKIVDTAFKHFGAVDIFINNAGVGDRRTIDRLDESVYDTMMDTNVKAVYHAFRLLIPRFREQGHGHIINISSMAARQGVPGMAVYAASKAALDILSESVAGEVRADNIKVSVVSPGSVNTGFGGKEVADQVPTDGPRPLLPDEVAKAVLHVAQQNDGAWQSRTEIRPLMTRKS